MLDHDIRETLVALRGLAPHLNRTADLIGQAVETLEDELNRLALGVTAEVEMERSNPRVRRCLAYGRVNGNFHIHLVDRDPDLERSDWIRTRWSQCTRDVKIETVVMLEPLVEELFRRAQQLYGRAEGALALSVDLLARVREVSRG